MFLAGLLGVASVQPHAQRHLIPEEILSLKKVENEFHLLYPDQFTTVIDPDYNITEISPMSINNDELVTISFTVQNGKQHSSDWIAAYSPPGANITLTVPVKYAYCDESPDYLSTGVGSIAFNLTNLRDDVEFVLMRGGTYQGIATNIYNESVTFNSFAEPLRPRVVPTGDLDVFNLLWSSNSSVNPMMKWGISSGNYTVDAPATAGHIDKSEFCTGWQSYATTTGWRDLGIILTAPMEGMKALANQKIYYIFGDEQNGGWSREYVFFAPPLPGTQPPNRPTRVILYDDLGRGSADQTFTWNEYGRPSINTTMAVAQEIMDGNVDAVYHGGDISYATGYLAVWDFFLDQLGPVASATLYLTTVGNHESDWPDTASIYEVNDSGGECGVASCTLIPMPAPATINKPWWTYDIGLIHFVGMSTEHNFTVGSEQWEFLKNDLESVNRTITPWIIFGGHRAMYLNSNYGGNPTSDIAVMNSMIENLEPLLIDNKVDLGFYGHNHVVQRHSAVVNKTIVQKAVLQEYDGEQWWWHQDPKAPVHMVVGTGGATFSNNSYQMGSNTQESEFAWNEDWFQLYGYTRVEAVSPTMLKWEWVDAGTGVVYDRMIIDKSGRSTDADDSDELSEGTIAGVVVGALAFAGIAGYLVWSKFFSNAPSDSATTKLVQDNDKSSASDQLYGGQSNKGLFHAVDRDSRF